MAVRAAGKIDDFVLYIGSGAALFCWFLWSAWLFVQDCWCAMEMEFSGRGDAAGSCVIKEVLFLVLLAGWLVGSWVGYWGPSIYSFLFGVDMASGGGASAFVLFVLSGYPNLTLPSLTFFFLSSLWLLGVRRELVYIHVCFFCYRQLEVLGLRHGLRQLSCWVIYTHVSVGIMARRRKCA